MINIYISSSLKGLKRQSGVVGYVIERTQLEEVQAKSRFGVVKEVSDNQAQLLALQFALKDITYDISNGSGLTIWTENQYVANAFEQDWIKGWIQRDWKTAKGVEVANREEWEKVLKILSGTVPTFEVKKRHSYQEWLVREVERRAKKYV